MVGRDAKMAPLVGSPFVRERHDVRVGHERARDRHGRVEEQVERGRVGRLLLGARARALAAVLHRACQAPRSDSTPAQGGVVALLRKGRLFGRPRGPILPARGEAPMDYRVETDSMGEVKVAKDCYWGAQTQRSLENFKNRRPALHPRGHPGLRHRQEGRGDDQPHPRQARRDQGVDSSSAPATRSSRASSTTISPRRLADRQRHAVEHERQRGHLAIAPSSSPAGSSARRSLMSRLSRRARVAPNLAAITVAGPARKSKDVVSIRAGSEEQSRMITAVAVVGGVEGCRWTDLRSHARILNRARTPEPR